MLIQKNVRTSFLCNAGRRRSSANGWSASYQLLDKTGNVLFPVGGGYSTQDLQEIGNGLYGVALTFNTTYCGFIRWKISDGIEDLYTVEPYTILSSYGTKGVEQTFISNFGKSRTGKNVQFRVLKEDLSEERTWNNTGLIELGFGIYGVAVQINSVFTGYMEWRDNTDGLYVSDPILIFDSLNPPIIEISKTTVVMDETEVGVSVSQLSVDVLSDDSIVVPVISNLDLAVSINQSMEAELSVS